MLHVVHLKSFNEHKISEKFDVVSLTFEHVHTFVKIVAINRTG